MRIWLRCYPHSWNRWRENFVKASVDSKRRCPFTGFIVCESFPNVDFARQKKAMDEARALGYTAIPGLILNIGSHIANPGEKYLAWEDPNAWQPRLQKARVMSASGMQDPMYKAVYIDLELYDSTGQEHASWNNFLKVYNAAISAAALENFPVILTQYYEGFCQNMALARRLRSVTWVHESYWSLPKQDAAAAAANIDEMVSYKLMLDRIGQRYWPQTMQDIGRDYAEPIRNMLIGAGITDVFSWASNRASDDDVDMLCSEAWFSRPLEPAVPVDLSKMGLMAFDLKAGNEPSGDVEYAMPTPGSIAPVFHTTVPIKSAVVDGRRALVFDGTPNQGLRANLGRQISERYTLAFVGRPPSWRLSNDGTGWMLGRYRARATQAPAGGLDWGGAIAPIPDNDRHVIVCEQTSNELRIYLDGVRVGSATGMINLPDGTMTIGNNDALTSRPVRMELERLVLFEGNDVVYSLSQQLCVEHGIRYRRES